MRARRQAPVLTLQAAATIALLAALWHVADGAEAARRLADADLAWLAAGFVALSAQTVLSALRWRLTAARLGIVLGVPTALREYYLSQIVNQILPGGVLGDAGRAVRARAQAGLLASGQAVAFERLAGQIGIFALLAAGFALTLALPGGLDWPAWLRTPVALAVGLGLAAPGILWALGRFVPGAAGRGLSGLGRAFAHAVAAPEVRGRQVALSLSTALCNVMGFGFCAWAVGADIGIAAIVSLVPIILFTMLVPLTVSGWGLREGAAAALFPIAGATASEGLAASVAFGLLFLVSVLPGAALFALRPAQSPVKP